MTEHELKMEVDNLVTSMRKLDNDLEKYRMYWETNSDWNARKQFLSHNWGCNFAKEKLVSLSCAWANVHFLGNDYPAAVMQQLKTMEVGLKLADSNLSVNAQPMAVPLLYNPAKLPQNFIQVRFVKSGIAFAADDANVSSEQNNVTLSSIAHCAEVSNCNKPAINSITSFNCKMTDNNNAECENLTKKLKNALKIPENVLPKTSVTSQDASSQAVVSFDIVDKSTRNLYSKIECFAAAIKDVMNIEPSNVTSSFFNIAVDLSLNPKFICGMANEEHVSLFDQWKCQTGIQHKITNFSWVCDIYVSEVFLSQGCGKTVSIAKDFAVASAKNLLESRFTIDLINRSVSSSMFASQYAVILKENIAVYSPPPIVTLKGVPVIEFGKKLCSSSMPVPKTSDLEKSKQTSNLEVTDIAIQQDSVCIKDRKMATYSKFSDYSTETKPSEDLDLKKLLKTRLKEDLSNFIVVVFADSDDPVQTLNTLANMNKIQISYKYDTSFHCQLLHTCSISLNNVELVTSTGVRKDSARLIAVTKLLRHLIAYFPCMIKLGISENPDKSLKKSEFISGKSLIKQPTYKPIPGNNVGNQLLRKMGWSGSGGLGRMKDGIAEPIEVSGRYRCIQGLGHEKFINKNVAIKKGDAMRVISQYIRDGCVGNLSFSSELSNEDRKQLHACATQFGLKSKSFGKGVNRHLVVFKNLSLLEIHKQLTLNGGEVNGYILPS